MSELPLKVGPKSGTTKVQLGADRTEGADGAEHKIGVFPRKSKIPSKNGKNNVLRKSPPSAPYSKFKRCE
jgi:hypothetical protein